jgi:enoyl-CoA hydratase
MTGPSTTGGHVDVDVIRDVAVLTLDRPEKLNALDIATRLRLAELIRAHGAGDTVRGIVLTGRGRAFSAGEDLTQVPTTESEVRLAFESFHDVTRAILATRVPPSTASPSVAPPRSRCPATPGSAHRRRSTSSRRTPAG